MARTPKKPGTALTNWREEMSGAAQRAAAMEQSTGGGKFFTMRAGVLKYDDAPLPGNQLVGIILHSIYENTYYETDFDPDNRTAPTCFAFWDEDYPETMRPHEIVDKETDTFKRQHDECDGCWANEWASADRGKGKACANRRRLAIIPAGTYRAVGKGGGFDLNLFDEAELFAKAEMGYMKVPVTSVRGYSKFVRDISEQLGRPPWGVFTRIYLEPDANTQFKVHFELLDEIPDEYMDAVFKRATEARKEIAFPYTPRSEEDEKPAPVRKSSAAKVTKGAKTTNRRR